MSGMSSSGKSSLTGASIPFEGAVEVHAVQALLNSYLQTARDNQGSSTIVAAGGMAVGHIDSRAVGAEKKSHYVHTFGAHGPNIMCLTDPVGTRIIWPIIWALLCAYALY